MTATTINSFRDIYGAVTKLVSFVNGLDGSHLDDAERLILVYNEMADILCDLETLIDADAATRPAPDVDDEPRDDMPSMN